MKIVLIILSILIVASLILLIFLGIMSKSGKAPGLVEGRLFKCSSKPNCVCSEQFDDPHHYIKPISIPENITYEPLSILKNIIREMGGRIETENGDYLSSTFSSAIFGFVDDVEIRIDSDKQVIHIRSASRVGHGDRGVNKVRTELLKKRYDEKISDK